MLHAVPVLDAASYELDAILFRFVHELDEAGDVAITVWRFGDSSQSGAIHSSLLSPFLREKQAREALRYVEDVHKTGREDFHRLGEMKSLAKFLDLVPADVPCIVFLAPSHRQVGLFRLVRRHYESPNARTVFCEVFRDWVATEDVRRVALADENERQTARKLRPLLQQIPSSFDSRMAADGPNQILQSAGVLGLDELAWYPPTRLAAHFQVSLDALLKRLDRFRERNDGGWREYPERSLRESKHLYQLRAVRTILNDLQASSKRPAR